MLMFLTGKGIIGILQQVFLKSIPDDGTPQSEEQKCLFAVIEFPYLGNVDIPFRGITYKFYSCYILAISDNIPKIKI